MAINKEKRKPEDISVDAAVCEMLKNMDPEISTVFDRSESMKPCPIGSGVAGICCKNCSMGPCRVKEGKTGLCGATIGTIAARNLARGIAAGASAHSDHGRDLAHLLGLAAQDKAEGVKIKDEEKLIEFAKTLEIKTEGREISEIGLEVSEKALSL